MGFVAVHAGVDEGRLLLVEDESVVFAWRWDLLLGDEVADDGGVGVVDGPPADFP